MQLKSFWIEFKFFIISAFSSDEHFCKINFLDSFYILFSDEQLSEPNV